MRPERHRLHLRTLILSLALLGVACAAPKPADPDFVVFATGSLYGQLHTCG